MKKASHKRRRNGKVIRTKPIPFNVFTPEAVALIKAGEKEKVFSPTGKVYPRYLKILYKQCK